MTATISEYRVRSAQSQVDFLQREVDSWRDQQIQTQSHAHLQDLLLDMNQLFHNILQLDSSLQEAYFDGLPYSEGLSEAIHILALRWASLGQLVLQKAGRTTDGLTTLQKNLREAEAILNPSSEMGEYIDSLRERAAIEHKNQQTLEGLVD